MTKKGRIPYKITLVILLLVFYILLILGCESIAESFASNLKYDGISIADRRTLSSGTQPTLNSAESYYRRAQENYQNGNYDLAIEDYSALILLSPNSPQPYNERAWIYVYHLKTNLDQAIVDTSQAIKLNPNYANSYGTRGWAYLVKGDYNNATNDLIKALELDPSLAINREALRIIRETLAEEVIDWSEFE